MTKDEWKALEMELSFAYGNAKLRIDGFEVNFQVRQDKMRLVICVFVNGWMRGEWLVKKTEEATRFCRPVTHSLYSPAQIKKLTAGMRKSSIKSWMSRLEKKFVIYTSFWLSFSALKRHLIANNKQIELVDPAPVEVLIETSP